MEFASGYSGVYDLVASAAEKECTAPTSQGTVVTHSLLTLINSMYNSKKMHRKHVGLFPSFSKQQIFSMCAKP